MKFILFLIVAASFSGLYAQAETNEKQKPSNLSITFIGLDSVTDKPLEILSWSWGLAQTIKKENTNTELQLSDLSFTKFMDTETPKLVQTASENKKIKTLIFKSITNVTTVLTLRNVKITSVNMGGAGYGDTSTEVYSLSFESMDIEITNPTKKITGKGKITASTK